MKRIHYIDLAKGIGIILVILGHISYIGDSTRIFVVSFHMPLFFLLTGFTLDLTKLKDTGVWTYCRRLLERMLVPYIWMQFLSFIPRFIQKRVIGHSETPVEIYLQGILLGHSHLKEAPSNPLYFLLLLFLAQLLLFLLVKLTRGKRYLIVFFAAMLLPVSLFTQGKDMIWHCNVVPAVLCFILVGNMLRSVYERWGSRILEGRLWKTFVLCALLYGIGFVIWRLNGRTSFHGNQYGHHFALCVLTAVSTSMAFALITIRLPRIGFLELTGRNTLFLMGLHRPLLLCMEALFPKQKRAVWFIVLAIVLCYLLLIPAIRIAQKYAPFILGRAHSGNILYQRIGLFISMVGATCVPYGYFLKHYDYGLWCSNRIFTAVAIMLYMIACGTVCLTFSRKPPCG